MTNQTFTHMKIAILFGAVGFAIGDLVGHHSKQQETIRWRTAAGTFEKLAKEAQSTTIRCLEVAKNLEADLNYHKSLPPNSYPLTFVSGSNGVKLITISAGWSNIVLHPAFAGSVTKMEDK